MMSTDDEEFLNDLIILEDSEQKRTFSSSNKTEKTTTTPKGCSLHKFCLPATVSVVDCVKYPRHFERNDPEAIIDVADEKDYYAEVSEPRSPKFIVSSDIYNVEEEEDCLVIDLDDNMSKPKIRPVNIANYNLASVKDKGDQLKQRQLKCDSVGDVQKKMIQAGETGAPQARIIDFKRNIGIVGLKIERRWEDTSIKTELKTATVSEIHTIDSDSEDFISPISDTEEDMSKLWFGPVKRDIWGRDIWGGNLGSQKDKGDQTKLLLRRHILSKEIDKQLDKSKQTSITRETFDGLEITSWVQSTKAVIKIPSCNDKSKMQTQIEVRKKDKKPEKIELKEHKNQEQIENTDKLLQKHQPTEANTIISKVKVDQKKTLGLFKHEIIRETELKSDKKKLQYKKDDNTTAIPLIPEMIKITELKSETKMKSEESSNANANNLSPGLTGLTGLTAAKKNVSEFDSSSLNTKKSSVSKFKQSNETTKKKRKPRTKKSREATKTKAVISLEKFSFAQVEMIHEKRKKIIKTNYDQNHHTNPESKKNESAANKGLINPGVKCIDSRVKPLEKQTKTKSSQNKTMPFNIENANTITCYKSSLEDIKIIPAGFTQETMVTRSELGPFVRASITTKYDECARQQSINPKHLNPLPQNNASPRRLNLNEATDTNCPQDSCNPTKVSPNSNTQKQDQIGKLRYQRPLEAKFDSFFCSPLPPLCNIQPFTNNVGNTSSISRLDPSMAARDDNTLPQRVSVIQKYIKDSVQNNETDDQSRNDFRLQQLPSMPTLTDSNILGLQHSDNNSAFTDHMIHGIGENSGPINEVTSAQNHIVENNQQQININSRITNEGKCNIRGTTATKPMQISVCNKHENKNDTSKVSQTLAHSHQQVSYGNMPQLMNENTTKPTEISSPKIMEKRGFRKKLQQDKSGTPMTSGSKNEQKGLPIPTYVSGNRRYNQPSMSNATTFVAPNTSMCSQANMEMPILSSNALMPRSSDALMPMSSNTSVNTQPNISMLPSYVNNMAPTNLPLQCTATNAPIQVSSGAPIYHTSNGRLLTPWNTPLRMSDNSQMHMTPNTTMHVPQNSTHMPNVLRNSSTYTSPNTRTHTPLNMQMPLRPHYHPNPLMPANFGGSVPTVPAHFVRCSPIYDVAPRNYPVNQPNPYIYNGNDDKWPYLNSILERPSWNASAPAIPPPQLHLLPPPPPPPPPPIPPRTINDPRKRELAKPVTPNFSLQDDLIIGRNDAGVVRKIILTKRSDQAQLVPSTPKKKDDIYMQTTAVNPTLDKSILSKSEMLEELTKSTMIDLSKRTKTPKYPFKMTAELTDLPPKKQKLDAIDTECSHVSQKGYSLPILPIPTYETYQKTMQLLSENRDSSIALSTENANARNKITGLYTEKRDTPKSGNAPSTMFDPPSIQHHQTVCIGIGINQTVNLNARYAYSDEKTNEGAGGSDMDKSQIQKISLDAYKKRTTNNDEPAVSVKMEIKSEFSTPRADNIIRQSTESDLGYGSDSTMRQ